MKTTYESLRIGVDNGVAEVVLIGPGKGNAMGPEFWREMPEAFIALDAEPGVRAVIVRGVGKHFSYGLDLTAMMADLGPFLAGENLVAARTRFLNLIVRMQQACDRVARCRKPVIAAIDGWCVGGGVDLITACDVRLCTEAAKFSVREVRLAIVADMGSLQRLPRLIGHGHARELAYTGRDIDAARALRIGLVNDVLTSQDALLEAARTMAREIANNPPLVVQGIKQVMDYAADHSLADGLQYVAVWNAAFLQSRDLQEALSAFMERRPPQFTGE